MEETTIFWLKKHEAGTEGARKLSNECQEMIKWRWRKTLRWKMFRSNAPCKQLRKCIVDFSSFFFLPSTFEKCINSRNVMQFISKVRAFDRKLQPTAGSTLQSRSKIYCLAQSNFIINWWYNRCSHCRLLYFWMLKIRSTQMVRTCKQSRQVSVKIYFSAINR